MLVLSLFISGIVSGIIILWKKLLVLIILTFCFRYQQLLHKNLMYLASFADSTQNIQAMIPPVCVVYFLLIGHQKP